MVVVGFSRALSLLMHVVLPPLCNSWIIFHRTFIFRALIMIPKIDCYRVGQYPTDALRGSGVGCTFRVLRSWFKFDYSIIIGGLQGGGR